MTLAEARALVLRELESAFERYGGSFGYELDHDDKAGVLAETAQRIAEQIDGCPKVAEMLLVDELCAAKAAIADLTQRLGVRASALHTLYVTHEETKAQLARLQRKRARGEGGAP